MADPVAPDVHGNPIYNMPISSHLDPATIGQLMMHGATKEMVLWLQITILFMIIKTT